MANDFGSLPFLLQRLINGDLQAGILNDLWSRSENVFKAGVYLELSWNL